ncbi:hypothetical protein [Pseudomonas mosselii]|uniref:Translation initiation factor 2 n=1 Tax=Pseudomonas mosselii TaxID=78327 RepID=A0AA42S1G5_9PSED|nr:hypothetical protein [Pseudomonas mosselii]MDH1633646.1 hypothetical protein [Pseudomonas mosselii]
MNLLRPLVIALCFALSWLSAGSVQAAESATKAQGVYKPVNKASVKAPAKPQAKPVTKAKPKPKPKAVTKPLPQPKIDLSLPRDMVKHLEPDLGDGPVMRKPLLPSMFPTKPESDSSPFQLNGRLISNEMQLQLRNDSRRDVEGAAIEFEFRN